MRKTLALLSLCAIFPAQSFAAEKKTPEQYWNETGLSTEVMVKSLGFLTIGKCYENIREFRGCIAALNSIAARTQPATRFVPFALADDASMEFGPRVNAFAGLTQVQIKEAADLGSLRLNTEKDHAKRAKIDAAEEQLFQFARNAKVDFENIFTTIRPQAIKDRNDDAKVAGEAISAHYTESLDAHARIEPTAQGRDTINDADASFVGIGATIQELNGKLLIGEPIENSPAERADVRAKDEIVAIDGMPAVGMKADAAVKLIRGPEGSKVVLRLRREKTELTITIIRGRISQENVETKVVADFGLRVGVVKLRTFMDQSSCSTMSQKIVSLVQKDQVQALVIDLRGNGGGLLAQAVCMGGFLVKDKVIVKTKDLVTDRQRDLVAGRIGEIKATNSYLERAKIPLSVSDLNSIHSVISNLPIAVLINAGSASASEVLSGALQDHQRALIVGERSFGKGSVQAPFDFLGQYGQITEWKTVQRFYQPSGRTNQIVGIVPDMERPFKPDATEDERFFLREKDYFPGALDAESQPWKQTRPDVIASVEACVGSGNLAKNKYKAEAVNGKTPDYQLFSAEEILRCSKK